MNERKEKRRVEAKKRIIPQNELKQLDNMRGASRVIKKDTHEYQENKQKDNKITNRKRKRQFGRYAIVVLLLAIIIVVMLLYLLFYTKKLDIQNNEYSTDDNLVEWFTADPWSTNTITAVVKYNLINIDLPGGVESVSMKMKNPWELILVIEDKQPVSGFEINGKYVYCDEEGTAILELNEQKPGLPLIQGIEVTEYALYEQLPVEDVDIFENALEVTNILNRKNIEVDTISCAGAADVDITIGNKLIKLGENNYEEKISQINPILEKISEDAGILYLENFTSSNATVSFERKISEN